jgi:hypothetical protein
MRTAEYTVFLKPRRIERTQNSKGPHGVTTVEYVVDNALEVIPAEHKTIRTLLLTDLIIRR